MSTPVQLLRIGTVTLLILACRFLPFLPGSYDGMAVTLSGMSQVLGVLGLLVVPIGLLWLIFPNRSYYFAIAALVASSFVAAIVCLVAVVNMGPSLGIGLLAIWTYAVSRIMPRLKFVKSAPLDLVVVPIVVAIIQFWLVGPATEFSRNRAITNSAALIHDIEQYQKANGRYPTSLHALWPDYKPSIIGIKQFHYEPNGDAYNVYFEQLSDQLGTQEIVMYNKLDQHSMPSHAMDILHWTPEQLRTRRGYYAVHDASTPRWKFFWFD